MILTHGSRLLLRENEFKIKTCWGGMVAQADGSGLLRIMAAVPAAQKIIQLVILMSINIVRVD